MPFSNSPMGHGKPFVCVHWLDADASSPTEAYSEEDLAKRHHTTPMQTYGLMTRIDDTGVTIVNEYYEEDGKAVFRGRNFIPAMQVVGVEILGGVKRTRKTKAPVEQSLT